MEGSANHGYRAKWRMRRTKANPCKAVVRGQSDKDRGWKIVNSWLQKEHSLSDQRMFEDKSEYNNQIKQQVRRNKQINDDEQQKELIWFLLHLVCTLYLLNDQNKKVRKKIH
jgi:hypothetical protein